MKSLFSLAYRYLIEREEAPVLVNNTIITTEYASNINKSEANYDDWSYTRDDLEINIEKVESGSGKDKITYYVADVQIKDTSDLYTAFAKKKIWKKYY